MSAKNCKKLLWWLFAIHVFLTLYIIDYSCGGKIIDYKYTFMLLVIEMSIVIVVCFLLLIITCLNPILYNEYIRVKEHKNRILQEEKERLERLKVKDDEQQKS